jgi:hypothetical protein
VRGALTSAVGQPVRFGGASTGVAGGEASNRPVVGVPEPGTSLVVPLPPPPFVGPPGVPDPGVSDPGVVGVSEGGVVGIVGPVWVSVTFVVIVVEQVTVLPPPFSDPLHWSTVTGNEALVVPDAVHTSVAPPPLPEPLHWDTAGEACALEMHAATFAPPP